MIFLTLGDRIFIMELARGSFQDENSVPSCKKYHSLAHASKNLYVFTVILTIYVNCCPGVPELAVAEVHTRAIPDTL